MPALDTLLPLPERAPIAAAPGSVGATLWLAVAEQTRRLRRHARLVLLGADPEDLHQLRVAVRRLRAALALGHEALDLPDPLQPERLAGLAHSLGRLRDLDVGIAMLEALVPVAKGAQSELLQHALRRLGAQRRAARRRARAMLRRPQLQRTLRALRRWIREPGFLPFAHRPASQAGPLLLQPAVRALRAHPGWERPRDPGRPAGDDERVLHDLRKAAKGLRYRIEILSRPAPDARSSEVDRLVALQDVLGELHDLADLEQRIAGREDGLLDPRRGLVARHAARRRAELLKRWAGRAMTWRDLGGASADRRPGLHVSPRPPKSLSAWPARL